VGISLGAKLASFIFQFFPHSRIGAAMVWPVLRIAVCRSGIGVDRWSCFALPLFSDPLHEIGVLVAPLLGAAFIVLCLLTRIFVEGVTAEPNAARPVLAM
jgi:hypothetical protein